MQVYRVRKRHQVVFVVVALLWPGAVPGQSPDPANLPAVAGQEDDIRLRSGLLRCRDKFQRSKVGVVAYVGGSITHNPGWSQLVDAELQRRFPETQFTFVHAGISSIDSSGHAFRLQHDVLERAIPDLLFVEAAVNDLHNDRMPVEQLRGVEGVVRRALRANRDLDIVLLHFAEPRHTADYEQGRTPEVIRSHERVAEHYQLASVDLAHEVQRRLHAGQFDWARDFKDLHPSPFGQQLYFQSVRRLFDRAWRAEPAGSPPAPRRDPPLPEPLDAFAYDAGQMVPVSRAFATEGFQTVAAWRPADKAGTRAGFVDVPLFVGERPGSQFSLRFEGRGVGLFLTAGPDAGIVEYRIDGGDWRSRDTFTRWSRGLHLPWVLMLETELVSGPHRLDLRLSADRNPASAGTALRVRDFLVNGPSYQVPPLTEIRIASTLDQTEQPSLLWAPDQARTRPTPLLVYLHSWSGDYRQDNSAWLDQAARRGWIFLHPNFRGVNEQPQACGSRLARQDILDAMDHVGREFRVDRERIYLAGSSGGGHMSLLMAGHFPRRFSAVSAWVGISDLADWYRVHSPGGRPGRYAQMIAASLGGPPGQSPAVDEQYRERSPLFHLDRAGDLPVDIAAGVEDGHTGSVPIFHSLRAFNVVARAGGHSVVTEAEMDQLWNRGRLDQPRPSDIAEDPSYGRAILLRRNAGPARVTIFDGGHEGLAHAGCAWLAGQKRAVDQAAER